MYFTAFDFFLNPSKNPYILAKQKFSLYWLWNITIKTLEIEIKRRENKDQIIV